MSGRLRTEAGSCLPASGEVYFNEVSTRRLRYNEARRQVGYVTQETSLFGGTVRENMLFVRPDASDDQILSALEQMRGTRTCLAITHRLTILDHADVVYRLEAGRLVAEAPMTSPTPLVGVAVR